MQRLSGKLLPRQPICVSTETNPEQRISELSRLSEAGASNIYKKSKSKAVPVTGREDP
jgi:hypothetical protein